MRGGFLPAALMASILFHGGVGIVVLSLEDGKQAQEARVKFRLMPPKAVVTAQVKKAEEEKKAEAPKPPEVKPAPKVEPPKVEPRKEPPKVEPPKVEPKAEQPLPEEPKPELPMELPKPRVEEKKVKPKAPKRVKPKSDAPDAKLLADAPKAGPKKGATIDLDYAMTGGTNSAGVQVVAGDGMDVEDDGSGQDGGSPAGSQDPADQLAGGGQDEWTDEESESAWGDQGASSGAGAARGPGASVGGGGSGGERKGMAGPPVKTVAAAAISKPAAVSKPVNVAYPEEVKPLEIQGRVSLQLTVSEAGEVVEVRLVRGLHPKLDQLSMDAAWKLEFSPALKDGKPVAVKIPYTFTFVLE